MVTFYSGWASYGSAGQMRLALEIDDPPTVSIAMASVTLGGRSYIETTQSLNDSSNTCTLSGTLGSTSGAVSVSHSGAATTLLKSVSAAVATQYGAAVVVTVNATGGPFASEGRNLSVSGSVTIPARPYAPPAAPTDLVVTRVSDSQQNLAWTNTNPGSASAPYQGVTILRRDNVDTSWVTMANLGVVTSWSDTSTQANRLYDYQVAGANSSGVGIFSGVAQVPTTPAAPSNFTATKSGSNIALAWTLNASYGCYSQVWRREGSGSYVFLADLPPGVSTYTHTAPNPAVTHQYQVVSYVASPSVTSGTATSNVVQLTAPPNAPTTTGPTTAQDASTAITRSWVHNPVDSSPQTKFQTQWRQAGTGTWNVGAETAGATASTTAAANSFPQGVTIEWQVRTWGAHANPSPWSATATFETSASPTATITAPGTTHTLPTLQPVVAYYQAQSVAQAGWELELRSAANVLLVAATGTGAIPALAYMLVNATGYTLRARTQSAKGLWSAWASKAFTVDFPEPAQPTVSATWDRETGSVQVAVANPAPVGDELDAATNTVYRRINGGAWVQVAAGVARNGSMTDYLASAAGVNEYRVDAVSSLGTTTPSTPVAVETAEQGLCYLNFGPGFSSVVTVWGNVQWSGSVSREVTLHNFAGRTYPVAYVGEHVAEAGTLAGKLAPDSSSLDQWREFARQAGVAWLRTPKGDRMPVAVGGLQWGHTGPTTATVSVAVTVVESTER